jgi:TonB family protein
LAIQADHLDKKSRTPVVTAPRDCSALFYSRVAHRVADRSLGKNMRILITLSGFVLILCGCSTPPQNDDAAYMKRASSQIIGGPAQPEVEVERAEKEKALGINLATPPAGAELKPAQLISMVRPIYPHSARAAGKEGSVMIAVIITAEGNVADAKLIEATDEVFVLPAIEAVKQWKFRPATIDGKPVSLSTSVPVAFSLQ